MSTEERKGQPAYLVQADGTLALNDTGIELEARYRRARSEHEALEASWAGAALARLFQKHTWLDAVTLSFTVTAEYDDSGGYYRCIHCQVQSVRPVQQQALPEELFPAGEFDLQAAEHLFEEEIEDSEFDLYAGLSGTPEGYDDLDVTLERRAIAAQLSQSPIDGHIAIAAWGLARRSAA